MSTRNFRYSIAALVMLFALLLAGRNHIRAHWWAMRLASSTDFSTQGYYLACLAGVGDAANGPAHSLARDKRAEVRLLSTYALQRLSVELSVPELARLLADPDLSVRDAAATALVFADNSLANDALIGVSRSDNVDEAAAAVSALGRIPTDASLAAIHTAARYHKAPFVRAQAIEALVDTLLTSVAPPPDAVATLVSALADDATYTGLLSLERQQSAAERFVAERTTSQQVEGTILRKRSIAELAAHYVSNFAGEPVGPLPSLDSPVRDRLVQQCLIGLAKRRESSPANAEMYKTITSAPSNAPVE